MAFHITAEEKNFILERRKVSGADDKDITAIADRIFSLMLKALSKRDWFSETKAKGQIKVIEKISDILLKKAEEMVNTKEGAFLVFKDEKGRYLMGLRAKGTNNAGKWGFFGGNVDPGEKPLKAAQREWQEETNIKAPKMRKMATLKNKQGDRVMHVFKGKLPSKTKIPLNKAEHSKYKWFKANNLPGRRETNPPARFIIKYLKS